MSNHLAGYGWALWAIIAGMALVTYINRAGLIVLSGKFLLPPAWQRALRFAPAAALSAIAVPDLFLHQGQVDVSLDNVRLIAGMIGLAVAVLTHSTTLAIGLGMVVLHGLLYLA